MSKILVVGKCYKFLRKGFLKYSEKDCLNHAGELKYQDRFLVIEFVHPKEYGEGYFYKILFDGRPFWIGVSIGYSDNLFEEITNNDS